jgi:hypothetical protein
MAAWPDDGTAKTATTKPATSARPNARPKPAPFACEGRDAVPINAIPGKTPTRGSLFGAIICDPDSLIAAPNRLGPRLTSIVVQLPQLGCARFLVTFDLVSGLES